MLRSEYKIWKCGCNEYIIVAVDYDYAYPFRVLGWDMNEEINPQVYSKKEWEGYSYTPFYMNVEQDKMVLI